MERIEEDLLVKKMMESCERCEVEKVMIGMDGECKKSFE